MFTFLIIIIIKLLVKRYNYKLLRIERSFTLIKLAMSIFLRFDKL